MPTGSSARHHLRSRLVNVRRGFETAALRVASLPMLWTDEIAVPDPNTIFSQRRRQEFRGHIQRLADKDPEMRRRLSERRIGGVRDWEYGSLLGLLLTVPERTTWRALDVGSGNSTFPRYLVSSGNVGSIVTLDLPSAHEPQTSPNSEADRASGVERVGGSMVDLPFPDASFDLVTCISAIEHLEGDRFSDEKPPHEDFAAMTRTALRDMVRVLRPGGVLLVTSEAYMPNLQLTDSWSSPDGSTPIWNAYPFDDIEHVFVETVTRAGATLIGHPDFRAETLLHDPDRANFRGRYFTTFCVAARKHA